MGEEMEPSRGEGPEDRPAAPRESVEREDGLYMKMRGIHWWTAKLPNRRVSIGRDYGRDLWAVRMKYLVSRERRKISVTDFCLSPEAMEAFITLHAMHKAQEARSAPESPRGSIPESPSEAGTLPDSTPGGAA